MLKIGVIGTGIIAESHGNALASMEGTALLAAADINPQRVENFKDKYGVAAYTDYKKMVEAENLDAVVINLPHGLHRDAAIFCLEKGLHVLLEKPMANTAQECREIMAAAEKSKSVLMIGHIQRYFAENIKVKELIKSGRYGALASVTDIRNINYFTDVRPKWFFDKKMAGGGILLNYGAHSLDKLLWIIGSEIMDVSGKVFCHYKDYEIEGGAQLLVEFEGGIPTVISYCGYKGPPVNETTFYMTEGVLKLRTGSGVWVSKGQRFTKLKIPSSQDAFVLMWQDFVLAVAARKMAYADGAYGLKIIAAIEEVYQSDRGGFNHKKPENFL